MKQAGVILLMLMFTVSQYATQFNYLECRLINAFSTSSVKCDCEKEVKVGAETDKNLPVSKSHVHHYVDENFTLNYFIVIRNSLETTREIFSSNNNDRILCGHTDEPYRPPLM